MWKKIKNILTIIPSFLSFPIREWGLLQKTPFRKGGQGGFSGGKQYSTPTEDTQSSENETSEQIPFPREFLDIIDNIFLTFPDISQAVKKTVHLGNTGHHVEFEGLSEAQAKSANEEIKNFSKTILKYSAGLDSFVNLLFQQAITKGAISLEIVPSLKFDSVEKIVFVPVKSIQFKKVDREFLPFQNLPGKEPIPLNPEQYMYIPLHTLENSPYGIPPFISAFHSLMIQKDGMQNVKNIIRKFGLLGFIFAQKRIPNNEGLSQGEYKEFLQKDLMNFSKSFRNNFNSGVAVAYDDTTIQHNQVTGDAKGVSDIFQLVEQQIASGIDIDPALLGRTYSTTETYAGVVYHSFLSSLTNTRRLIKRALEKILLMHLTYKGFPVKSVSIKFNPDKELNPEKAATAEKTKIENVLLKLNAGIIDLDTAAKELGYPKATGLAAKK